MPPPDPVDALVDRLVDDPTFVAAVVHDPAPALAPYHLSEAQLILVGVRIAESLSQVGDPVAERTRRAVLFSLARLAQVRPAAGR